MAVYQPCPFYPRMETHDSIIVLQYGKTLSVLATYIYVSVYIVLLCPSESMLCLHFSYPFWPSHPPWFFDV